jgi:uncharacterized membrane protein
VNRIDAPDADQRLDRVVGRILLTGVLVAAAVVLAGGIVFLIRYGHETFSYRVFQGEQADLRSFTGIIKSAMGLSGRGLIQLGLLVLIATPVARVFFSLFAFAAQKDKVYVIIAMVVLANLILGLMGAIS